MKEKRKNVHAFAVGRIVPSDVLKTIKLPVRIYYNPYAGPKFMAADDTDHYPVIGAGTVLLNERGFTAKNVVLG
jgi:hypothetical protein